MWKKKWWEAINHLDNKLTNLIKENKTEFNNFLTKTNTELKEHFNNQTEEFKERLDILGSNLTAIGELLKKILKKIKDDENKNNSNELLKNDGDDGINWR